VTRHRVLPGWRTLANAAHECVALGGEPLASSASPTSKAPTGTGISASASSVVGSRSVRSLAMRAALFLGVATTAAATNSSHGLDVDRDLRSAAQELMKSIAFDEEADPLQAVCGGALDAAMAAAAAMTPDESSQGEGDSTPARTDMHCAFDVHAMTLLPAIDELAARLKSAEVVLFPGDSPAPVLDSAPIAEMHEYAAAIPTFAPSARSLRRLHAWAMLLVSRNPSEDGSKGVSAVFTGVSGENTSVDVQQNVSRDDSSLEFCHQQAPPRSHGRARSATVSMPAPPKPSAAKPSRWGCAPSFRGLMKQRGQSVDAAEFVTLDDEEGEIQQPRSDRRLHRLTVTAQTFVMFPQILQHGQLRSQPRPHLRSVLPMGKRRRRCRYLHRRPCRRRLPRRSRK
jgi:hypothetical protein